MPRVLGTLAVSLLLLAFLDTVGADSVSIAVVNGKTTVTATGNSNDACPNAQYQVHDFSVAQSSYNFQENADPLCLCVELLLKIHKIRSKAAKATNTFQI